MREAGIEPANPKDVGLSDVALTTNRFARKHIFLFFWFYWGSNTPPNSYTTNLFKLVFGPYIVADVAVGVVAVVAVAGAIINIIVMVIVIVGVAVNIAYESVIVRII